MAYDIGKIQRIYLGVQGEYGSKPLPFNIAPWLEEFPEGSISIYHLRNGQDQSYPVATVLDSEEKVLYWTPNIVDTQFKGRGFCQFRLTVDGATKKTRIVPTDVDPALPGTMSEDVPPAIEPYVETIEQFKLQAQTARNGAEAAQEAAENAQEAAETAQEAAENAQEAAETAQEAAETAQEAAETAQEAAENAAELASGAADAAAGSASAASGSAAAAAGSASTASTAANAASQSASEAESSKEGADEAKDAALNAQEAAEEARDTILGMSVEAESISSDEEATVDWDSETGTMSFGIPKGQNGDNGYSPSVAIAEITGGHSVTITDEEHQSGQTFNVMDGTDGEDGDDGVSPAVTVNTITGGHEITITDKDHPAGQTFDVMDGEDAEVIIDDETPAVDKVYSSSKVSGELMSLNQAIGTLDAEMELKATKQELKEANRRIHLLEESAVGKLYTQETVTETSYQQDVPSGSLSNAVLGMWGGKSVVWNQLAEQFVGSSSTIAIREGTRIVSGHKYLMSADMSEGELWLYLGQNTGKHMHISSTNGILTSPSTVTADGTKSVGENSVWFYKTKASTTNPVLVDLTQMYGAGNEPSTTSDPKIAEIEAYLADHPEYNSGEIVSADVDDIQTLGKNLIELSDDKIVSSQRYHKTLVDGEIHFVSDGDYGRVGYGFELPNGTYTISFYGRYANGMLPIYLNSTSFGNGWSHDLGTINLTETKTQKSITLEITSGYLSIGFYMNAQQNEIIISDFQIEAGSSATSYKPYTVMNHPIPASVLTQYPLRSAIGGTPYDIITYEPTVTDLGTVPHWYHTQNVDEDCEVLDTPVRTEITSLMAWNGILEVEEGGTITFKQENGTIFAIPNTVNYLVKTTGGA